MKQKSNIYYDVEINPMTDNKSKTQENREFVFKTDYDTLFSGYFKKLDELFDDYTDFEEPQFKEKTGQFIRVGENIKNLLEQFKEKFNNIYNSINNIIKNKEERELQNQKKLEDSEKIEEQIKIIESIEETINLEKKKQEESSKELLIIYNNIIEELKNMIESAKKKESPYFQEISEEVYSGMKNIEDGKIELQNTLNTLIISDNKEEDLNILNKLYGYLMKNIETILPLLIKFIKEDYVEKTLSVSNIDKMLSYIEFYMNNLLNLVDNKLLYAEELKKYIYGYEKQKEILENFREIWRKKFLQSTLNFSRGSIVEVKDFEIVYHLDKFKNESLIEFLNFYESHVKDAQKHLSFISHIKKILSEIDKKLDYIYENVFSVEGPSARSLFKEFPDIEFSEIMRKKDFYKFDYPEYETSERYEKRYEFFTEVYKPVQNSIALIKEFFYGIEKFYENFIKIYSKINELFKKITEFLFILKKIYDTLDSNKKGPYSLVSLNEIKNKEEILSKSDEIDNLIKRVTGIFYGKEKSEMDTILIDLYKEFRNLKKNWSNFVSKVKNLKSEFYKKSSFKNYLPKTPIESLQQNDIWNIARNITEWKDMIDFVFFLSSGITQNQLLYLLQYISKNSLKLSGLKSILSGEMSHDFALVLMELNKHKLVHMDSFLFDLFSNEAIFIKDEIDADYLQDVYSFLDTYFIYNKNNVLEKLGSFINDLSKKIETSKINKQDYSSIVEKFKKHVFKQNIVEEFLNFINKNPDYKKYLIDLGNFILSRYIYRSQFKITKYISENLIQIIKHSELNTNDISPNENKLLKNEVSDEDVEYINTQIKKFEENISSILKDMKEVDLELYKRNVGITVYRFVIDFTTKILKDIKIPVNTNLLEILKMEAQKIVVYILYDNIEKIYNLFFDENYINSLIDNFKEIFSNSVISDNVIKIYIEKLNELKDNFPRIISRELNDVLYKL